MVMVVVRDMVTKVVAPAVVNTVLDTQATVNTRAKGYRKTA